MSKPTHTTGACPTCHTDFDRLPVEHDQDGGYAILEVRPCSDCTCGAAECEPVELLPFRLPAAFETRPAMPAIAGVA